MKVASIFLTLSLLLAACMPITQPGTTPPPQPATPPSVENTPENVEETPESAPETSSEDPLAGTSWVLDSFSTQGVATAPVGETPITLEFSNDGNVGGNAGCNSYGGPYQVEGIDLVFDEIVSTLIACADSDQMEQEIQFLEALQSVTTFQIDGDQLILHYDEGQSMLIFTRSTAAPSEEETGPTDTPAPEAEAPSTPAASDQPVAGVATGPSQNFLWTCYSCLGNQMWSFENGQANRIELPVEINYFYGYSPVTDRILYASPQPVVGGGPAQVTVGDLWVLDVASGQAEPVFSEQKIVEAELAPDGEQIAYVLATDTTYELRWHGLSGEDKLLASDVAFTFSISPKGDKVAFTRESNYDLPGTPGLYVVDVATGEEVMVADVDRAGAGSIDDKPIWSPSGQYLLLPTYGTAAGQSLVRAAADGSGSVSIGFDPSLSGEEWYGAASFSPIWISETQILGLAAVGEANVQLGASAHIMLYQLNEALDTIIGAEKLGEGVVVGWDIPGSSVWVQTAEGMQSIPLPQL
jgi:heat shock protein HslJ